MIATPPSSPVSNINPATPPSGAMQSANIFSSFPELPMQKGTLVTIQIASKPNPCSSAATRPSQSYHGKMLQAAERLNVLRRDKVVLQVLNIWESRAQLIFPFNISTPTMAQPNIASMLKAHCLMSGRRTITCQQTKSAAILPLGDASAESRFILTMQSASKDSPIVTNTPHSTTSNWLQQVSSSARQKQTSRVEWIPPSPRIRQVMGEGDLPNRMRTASSPDVRGRAAACQNQAHRQNAFESIHSPLAGPPHFSRSDDKKPTPQTVESSRRSL